MIKNFGDKETKMIWLGFESKKLPIKFQNILRRKLKMIHASNDINDLRVPPGNRLEKLKGDKQDYYSIRVNDQWRIIFLWNNNDAFNVQLIDYHK